MNNKNINKFFTITPKELSELILRYKRAVALLAFSSLLNVVLLVSWAWIYFNL